MNFILIVIFVTTGGFQNSIVMQEFTDEKACRHAAAVVRSAWESNGRRLSLTQASCVPKGAKP